MAAALSGCATSGSTVGAIGPMPLTVVARPLPGQITPSSTHIPSDAGAAVTPAGFVSFCLRFADQCLATAGAPTSVAMTPELWRKLEMVNDDVNSAIWPEDDTRHYGRAEYWNIPTDGYGDCEDYALSKRKALLAQGVPLGALRIAVVVTAAENRHAVLSVVTDKGDYVLDNLSNDVLPWESTGFTWIERQDPASAMAWVSLRPTDRMLAENTGGVTAAAH